MEWTARSVELLTKLWNEDGLSGTEISLRLWRDLRERRTRGAVIAKANRLNLAERTSRGRKPQLKKLQPKPHRPTRHRRKNGIAAVPGKQHRNHNRTWTQAEVNRCLRLHKEGRTLEEVSEIVGRSVWSVEQAIWYPRRNLPFSPPEKPKHITTKHGRPEWWAQNNDAFVQAMKLHHPEQEGWPSEPPRPFDGVRRVWPRRDASRVYGPSSMADMA